MTHLPRHGPFSALLYSTFPVQLSLSSHIDEVNSVDSPATLTANTSSTDFSSALQGLRVGSQTVVTKAKDATLEAVPLSKTLTGIQCLEQHGTLNSQMILVEAEVSMLLS